MRDKQELVEYLASHMDPLTPLEKRHIKKSLTQFKTSTLEMMASELEARAEEAREPSRTKKWLSWFESLFQTKKTAAP